MREKLWERSGENSAEGKLERQSGKAANAKSDNQKEGKQPVEQSKKVVGKVEQNWQD